MLSMSDFKADYFIAFKNASLEIWSFEECINYFLDNTGIPYSKKCSIYASPKTLDNVEAKQLSEYLFGSIQKWSFELWILITRQYGIMFKSCCCNVEDIIIIREDVIVVFKIFEWKPTNFVFPSEYSNPFLKRKFYFNERVTLGNLKHTCKKLSIV